MFKRPAILTDYRVYKIIARLFLTEKVTCTAKADLLGGDVYITARIPPCPRQTSDTTTTPL